MGKWRTVVLAHGDAHCVHAALSDEDVVARRSGEPSCRERLQVHHVGARAQQPSVSLTASAPLRRLHGRVALANRVPLQQHSGGVSNHPALVPIDWAQSTRCIWVARIGACPVDARSSDGATQPLVPVLGNQNEREKVRIGGFDLHAQGCIGGFVVHDDDENVHALLQR